MGKNRYGRLFAPVGDPKPDTEAQREAQVGGPAAVPLQRPSANAEPSFVKPTPSPIKAFRFKPDMGIMVNPAVNTLVEGTDIHALHSGWCSVTPIRATFASGDVSDNIETVDGNGKGLWKFKL